MPTDAPSCDYCSLSARIQPLPAQADGVVAPLKAWGIETVKVRMRTQ
jgi:hypothetical protein